MYDPNSKKNMYLAVLAGPLLIFIFLIVTAIFQSYLVGTLTSLSIGIVSYRYLVRSTYIPKPHEPKENLQRTDWLLVIGKVVLIAMVIFMIFVLQFNILLGFGLFNNEALILSIIIVGGLIYALREELLKFWRDEYGFQQPTGEPKEKGPEAPICRVCDGKLLDGPVCKRCGFENKF